MFYDVANMLKLNALDAFWLRRMADTIDHTRVDSVKWPGLSSFVFNLGQFARLVTKRLFDSGNGSVAADVQWGPGHKLLFEKIISSEFFKVKLEEDKTINIESFNQMMSGLFSLEMLGYKNTNLDFSIDKYLEFIYNQDFTNLKRAIPMSCYVIGLIYNRRYTEEPIPQKLNDFMEQVRSILVTETLSLNAEHRAQMHSLLVTMDVAPDETYAQWLKSDTFTILQTIEPRRIVYAHRLVSLLSPDLIGPEVISAMYNHTAPFVLNTGTGEYNGKAKRSKEDINEKRIIEGIFGCWVLTELGGLQQFEPRQLTHFFTEAMDLCVKHPNNDALFQTLIHTLAYVKAYNLP